MNEPEQNSPLFAILVLVGCAAVLLLPLGFKFVFFLMHPTTPS